MSERAPPKSEWGPGPWHDEPDSDRWRDPLTGLRCYAVRNPITGTWCGYVEVPRTSVLYGLPISHRLMCRKVHVHGGVTWSRRMRGVSSAWLIGFDCAHARDQMPALEATLRQAMPGYERPSILREYESYKTLAAVRAEVTAMAEQVHNAGQRSTLGRQMSRAHHKRVEGLRQGRFRNPKLRAKDMAKTRASLAIWKAQRT